MTSDSLGRMVPERHRELVRAAAQEFATTGYARASLNRIIRHCGMGKSSFYHVLSSKSELYELVVTDLMVEVRRSVRIPSPDSFGNERFWQSTAELLNHLAQASADNEALRALGRIFYLADSPDERTNAALNAIEHWLGCVLQAGRDAKQVRSELPLEVQRRVVFAILRTLDEWMLSRPIEQAQKDDATLLTAQFELLRRVLEP